jgi:hypothetical protein
MAQTSTSWPGDCGAERRGADDVQSSSRIAVPLPRKALTWTTTMTTVVPHESSSDLKMAAGACCTVEVIYGVAHIVRTAHYPIAFTVRFGTVKSLGSSVPWDAASSAGPAARPPSTSTDDGAPALVADRAASKQLWRDLSVHELHDEAKVGRSTEFAARRLENPVGHACFPILDALPLAPAPGIRGFRQGLGGLPIGIVVGDRRGLQELVSRDAADFRSALF